MGRFDNLKRNLKLQTISSKIFLSLILGGLFISATTQIIVSKTINNNEIAHIQEIEEQNMSYMEDYISKDGVWHIDNYTLKKGDVTIGDGNISGYNASEIFEQVEEKTNTFFYAFIHKNYINPEIYKTLDNSDETNYLRVAGSTKGENNSSLVGTYMDIKVSNHLAENDEYRDNANVEGVYYYCLYRNIYDSDHNLIGAMVAGRTKTSLRQRIANVSLSISIIIFLSIGILIIALSSFFFKWTKSLRKSHAYLKKIEGGTLPDKPLVVKTKDEIADIARTINAMTLSLKEKDRISGELRVATDIQANLLPNTFPAFPGIKEFDIYATMKPAREVGGDFYDFFMIDNNKVAMVIGDVSGKGVPSALFMAIAKTIIKNHLINGRSPARTLTLVNNLVSEDNKMCLFVTAWIGVVDLESGVLSYSNAGHNKPYIINKNNEVKTIKAAPGFVLGGLENMVYNQYQLQLEEGDKIYLYTDGVTEAMNIDKKLFGDDSLVACLAENNSKNIYDIVNQITNDVQSFSKGVEQSDDVTMLLFEFKTLMNKRIFKADKKEFDNVIEFVNKFLKRHDASEKVYNQIKISIEEIFVNIASYAYEEGEGDVEISIDLREDSIHITFKDKGVKFNPLEKADPNILLSLNERKIGGLGIFISKKMMDEIKYDYVDNQNVLTLVKKIKE